MLSEWEFILADSGSAVHACPRIYGSRFGTRPSKLFHWLLLREAVLSIMGLGRFRTRLKTDAWLS